VIQLPADIFIEKCITRAVIDICKQIISLIAHEHNASQPTLSQLRLYK